MQPLEKRIEAVAAAARRFLSAYDEFWGDYNPAVGEWLDALSDAVLELEHVENEPGVSTCEPMTSRLEKGE